MQAFAAADHRITALALEQNGGISAATNGALAAATGEFIVLMDHDDLLEPDALAELAAAAREPEVDIVYTDEDKLDELDRIHQPYFKPDWDPDLLLSYPYFGHVTAIRHEILRRIGGFRSAFDGSQDYDVMLRVDRAGPADRPRSEGPVPLARRGRFGRRGPRTRSHGRTQPVDGRSRTLWRAVGSTGSSRLGPSRAPTTYAAGSPGRPR